MRPTLAALCLVLAACSADPVLLPDAGPCSSACGAGTVCSGGACVAVDGGGTDVVAVADAGVDAPVIVDRLTPMDAPVAVADAGVDSGGADAGTADVGAPRDVDPRQSEVCRGVTTTCDGRTVNVQGGEVDGGRTYHCGACGVTCAVGEFCVNCVCLR